MLATVSDKIVGVDANADGVIDYFMADLVSAQDYYPFGMLMPSRKYSIANLNYRYGFNGQEKSNGINASGNIYAAEFWEYDSRIGRRWNVDPKPQIGISDYSAFNNNPIFFGDGDGDLVKIRVSSKAVGNIMINLYSAVEVKKRFKQVKVQVPVYQVTVTNESGKSSTFLYTRYNLRANIHNQNAVEDRTFDVNKDGDSFDGVIKSRWKGKNNVLELRATGRTVSEDQSGVIGMKGDKSNVERIAIQFHLLGASDGCLLAVSKGNLLPGNSNL